MHPYIAVLQTYLRALGESDYPTIKGLFAPSGRVHSPFLGEMGAAPFFDRLGGATSRNVITPIDLFLSATGKPHATAYFQYDWTVRDGTFITFKVMDLFTFAPLSDQATNHAGDPTDGNAGRETSPKVIQLDLIYDTHPIRVSAGNKYEA